MFAGRSAAALAVVVATYVVTVVQAQEGSLELTPAQSAFREFIVEEKYNASQAALTVQLIQSRSDYVPPGLDHNIYAFERPPIDDKGREDYRMNLLLDPCRNYGPDCCDGIFGAPEFRSDPTDMDEPPKTSDGNEKSPLTSRLPDPAASFDFSCNSDEDGNVFRDDVEVYLPSELPNGIEIITAVSQIPDLPGEDGSRCVDYHGALLPFPKTPRCWDNNGTIDATANCVGIGGTAPNCMMVGYAQTAFIAECGGEFRLSGRCGTFLEIHLPDDEEILSEVHVAGGLHTGFRLAAIPLNYKKEPNRLLCRGQYELWWVQRTRWNFQIEFKKKFQIVEPACTFDLLKSEYKTYRETKIASEVFDANPEFYGDSYIIGN